MYYYLVPAQDTVLFKNYYKCSRFLSLLHRDISSTLRYLQAKPIILIV